MVSFVERNSSTIKSLAAQYFSNPADREDAIQEASIKFMYVDAEAMEDEKAWAYSAVRNLFRDIHRSNARTQELDQWASIGNGVEEQCPLSVLVQEESEGIVERSIDDLPDDLSETAQMYYIKGLSYNLIATKLNVPEGTVASRMNAVRRYLSRG